MAVPITVLGSTALWPTTGDTNYSAGALQLQQLLAAAVDPIGGLYNTSTGKEGFLALNNSNELTFSYTGGPTVIIGGGSVTSVDASGGTTGLTFSGGPITSSGTLTLAGTLALANGGTGRGAVTSGALLYGPPSGTTLSELVIGSAGQVLTVAGGIPSWANPATSGTVTSVGISGANGIGVASSPITSSGTIALSLGAITPTSVSTGTVTSSANLTFTGTGNRITGDFSNGTPANRVMLQSSTVNGNTVVGFLPNGTSVTSTLNVYNNASPTNAAFGTFTVNASRVSIAASVNGAGTAIPLHIASNGLISLTNDTLGNIIMGDTGALATNATSRFLYVNGMAGTPIGTPVVPVGAGGVMAGKSAITVDTTGNQLYFYSGGAWRTPGTGTVTSVTVNGSAGRITSSGSPITTSGAITLDLDTTAVTPGSYTNADITVDAFGRVTAAANGSGGSTPAGLTTQIQYNNAGAFGASSKFTWTDASSKLTLSGTAGVAQLTSDALTQFQIYSASGGAGQDGANLAILAGDAGVGGTNNGNIQLQAGTAGGFAQGVVRILTAGADVIFKADGSIDFGTGVGTSGQVLTSAGAAKPTWTTPTTGTVTSVDAAGTQGVSISGNPITSSGTITIGLGNITPTSVSTAGNLTFSSTGQRILGDFSNATAANRTALQTGTVNGNTVVEVLPNGTGTNATIQFESDSAVANGSLLTVGYSASGFATLPASVILATKRGTGVDVPLSLQNNSLNGVLIDINGNVVMGGTAALATSATNRFLYVNSMAGKPTGTPTVPTSFTAAGKTPITIDSTNDRIYFYTNSAWHRAGVPSYESAVATAAQTVFNTTLNTVANTATKAFLQVYVNGVKQMEGATKAYTVTGANQITFNAGVVLNSDVEFYGWA